MNSPKTLEVAVGIDVLRATSTIVTALANGATAIIPASSLGEARKIKRKNPAVLLAGEREGFKLPDFDLGNSPFEFFDVKGKEIVITTSNGTKLINFLKDSRYLYIASFLNISAVAMEIQKLEPSELGIGCAGSGGEVGLEDVLCAGALIKFLLSSNPDLELTDSALIALELFNRYGGEIEKTMSTIASHGRKLIMKGFEKDVHFCAKIDLFSTVPVYREGKIVRNDL
ncbi:2-phosphosulfolactate phosphatase [Kosmotoga pacifica]|uniref:2-phosphosulfolactate phosphatase n=1 Tax=Kosmotoga pacifica TaxID=1330330 RepID=UPI00069CB67D|nr:2-phosphosulfolactate phosphatase [Kosmotoga pacifica]